MKKKNLYKVLLKGHKHHVFYDVNRQTQWEDDLIIEHVFFKQSVLDEEKDWCFDNGQYYKTLCNKENVHHWTMCGDNGYAVIHYIASIDRYVSLIYKIKTNTPLIIPLVGIFVYLDRHDFEGLGDLYD